MWDTLSDLHVGLGFCCDIGRETERARAKHSSPIISLSLSHSLWNMYQPIVTPPFNLCLLVTAHIYYFLSFFMHTHTLITHTLTHPHLITHTLTHPHLITWLPAIFCLTPVNCSNMWQLNWLKFHQRSHFFLSILVQIAPQIAKVVCPIWALLYNTWDSHWYS